MTLGKLLRLGLGIAFGALFLWLILRNITLSSVRVALQDANALLLLGAVAVFFVGYACRIARWRLMLSQENPAVSWRQCAGPLMASVAANNVLPFRAGDLLRAFGFNSRLGISAATSLTTLFVERLLDLLMVLAFLGLALSLFGADSVRFIGMGAGVMLAAATVALFVLLFPQVFKPLAFWSGRLASRLVPRLGARILQEIEKIFSVLAGVATRGTMVRLIAWSFLAWAAEGLVFWFVALALPSIGNSAAAWLALPLGTLSTLIPGTPGYVGTFDFFTAKAMSALGNELAASTAFALVIHVVLWLPPTLAGGLYLALKPVRHRDVLKARST